MAEFPDPIESTATPRQVLSVSALNRRARQLLETHLPLLWVEGELTNFSCPASGHWYFTLKDEHAQVRAAMFRTRNRLLNLRPVSGQQVLVRGRIGLYEPRGDYQLIVDHMEPAGQGLLQRRFDELKARLAAEGLFDIARKRALPTLPRCLGVVTSPTGAAIQDVLRVLRRRFPALPVFIYPTPVQGGEAAAGIVAALDFANRHGACDLLILTRGGGSLEDLWPFNEEAVARAVAASTIPVICGVGHETDVTIADFAADLRAPTPSAAAELASPDQNELLAALAGYQRRLERGMATLMLRFGTHLEALRRRLRHPRERLERQAQHLDHLEIRLVSAIRARLATDTARLHRLDVRRERHDPRQRLVQTRMRLAQLDAGLTQHMRQMLARAREHLEARAAVLHAVSPLNTLERGYAIVLDRSGRNVGQVTATRVGAELGVRLRDGRLDCTVIGIDTRDTLAIARDFTSGDSPPQD
ncbi:MAG: exodeoxyribonuclease VII large subunit [Porticoccaceae bacterium]